MSIKEHAANAAKLGAYFKLKVIDFRGGKPGGSLEGEGPLKFDRTVAMTRLISAKDGDPEVQKAVDLLYPASERAAEAGKEGGA